LDSVRLQCNTPSIQYTFNPQHLVGTVDHKRATCTTLSILLEKLGSHLVIALRRFLMIVPQVARFPVMILTHSLKPGRRTGPQHFRFLGLVLSMAYILSLLLVHETMNEHITSTGASSSPSDDRPSTIAHTPYRTLQSETRAAFTRLRPFADSGDLLNFLPSSVEEPDWRGSFSILGRSRVERHYQLHSVDAELWLG
jgi:hypothetical protein